jgi:uncharacterized DUF497 family protein
MGRGQGRRERRKHGVSFEMATLVFNDPFAIERLDDREDYGENRFILIGLAEGAVLTVVHTQRNDRIRIISARQATRHEQDNYFVENG